jgi:hypothetical protein
MALSETQQDILRLSLEKTVTSFFRQKAKKEKGYTILMSGKPKSVDIDVVGMLPVISAWVGDLIRGAPEDMRDDLFMAFANHVVEVAGIKAENPERPEMLQ